MSSTNFHALPIAAVTPATAEAATVAFAVPPALRDTFRYHAGQYVTLRFVINGKEERRAYSMSSSPLEEHVAVTIKRVKGGVVSNHVLDQLKPGDAVDVMPPQGRFLVKTDGAAKRDYYLFGAGSGITPLMSIIRAVLEEEPKSRLHLYYGNRREETIIFRAELAELQRRYAGQLNVVHTLSRPKKRKAGGLKGFLGAKVTDWAGQTGRISIRGVQEFLQAHPAAGSNRAFYVCGPGRMIDEVEQALLGLGVFKEHIHSERFVSAHQAGKEAAPVENSASDLGGGAQVQCKLQGQSYDLTLKPGQTILDGMLEAGAEPAYSCLAGACSTCMAKVTEGGVRMEVCFAIDDDEIAAGYVLTCQAHPTTPTVKVDFDG